MLESYSSTVRVAHRVATEHVIRQRRIRDRLVNPEDVEAFENFF
jgi:hypothetical protein